MLPNRVKLSTKATHKLQYIKSQTGVTPNILSRIAIMLAIKSGDNLKNAAVGDYNGQELDKGVLFGEHVDLYDVLINQYIHEHNITTDLSKVITSLIEVGVHKMGQVKSLVELSSLK